MKLFRILFAVLALCVAFVPPVALYSQSAAALMPVPKLQFLDTNGVPLAGGKVYTYAAGTTTPLATYTDSSGNTENADPIILDSGGFANIWMGPNPYKIVVEDANGVQQWTQDDVANLQGLLQGPNGSSIVNFTLPNVNGASTRTLLNKLSGFPDQYDFGAVCDGSTNDYSAFVKIAAYSGAVRIVKNAQTGGHACLISSALTLGPTVNLSFDNTAQLLPGGAITITMNGTVTAGGYQIFGGSGTVKFSATSAQYIVNPMWWGAKLDGSTDDTAAMQAALDNAPKYGTVLIEGNALTSSALTVGQSERLVCATNSLSFNGITGSNASADLIDVNAENGGVVEIHCDFGGSSLDNINLASGSNYLDRHSSFSGYWSGATNACLDSSSGEVWENTFNGGIDCRVNGAPYGVLISGDQSVAAIHFQNLHIVGTTSCAFSITQTNQTALMDNVVIEAFKPEVNSGSALCIAGGVEVSLYDAHFEQNGNNNPGIPDVTIAGGSGSVSYLNMYGGLFGVPGASQGNTRIKATGTLVKMNFVNTNFYRSGTDAIDGDNHFPVITFFGNAGRPLLINTAQVSGPGFSFESQTGNTGSYSVGQESTLLCNPTSANPETATLPAVADYPDREVTVVKNSAYRTCTVTTSDSSSIRGLASDSLTKPWQSRTYWNDGSNWYMASFENLGALQSGTGSQLTISAGSVTPVSQVHHVTGSGPITTIVTPSGIIDGEDFYAISDSGWTATSAGNILLTGTYTSTTNMATHFRWSSVDSKWYIVQ